ncbi:hypothetical protein Ga0080559_TMP2488 [Salipiger profundus]|uniref:Uncharacterized protein n=1 Tax=Salipiger profundus TaxID=1229727 RepID=A0A1U7D537_9RHOB|nr:hypothetical protein Ga0080559_TMP2488 [Salipiger profundus]
MCHGVFSIPHGLVLARIPKIAASRYGFPLACLAICHVSVKQS